MKFRLRQGKNTQLLETADECTTLGHLHQAIRDACLAKFHIGQDADFEISVNKKVLLTDREKSLHDYGIVSGDIIWIHLAEGSPAMCCDAATSSRTDDSRAGGVASRLREDAPGSVEAPPGSRAQRPKDTAAAQRTSPPPHRETPAGGSLSASGADEKDDDDDDAGASSRACAVARPLLSRLVMRCDDSDGGRVPELLEREYELAGVTSASDALTLVLHVLMIEAGFAAAEQDQSEPEQAQAALPSCLPKGWRRCGVYMLKYSHPLCPGATCKLTCVPIGHVLVVNASVSASKTTLNISALKLTPSSYVHLDGAAAPAKEASCAYRALALLSRTFKDHVAYPALSLMRQALELPCAVGLLALPVELQLQVLRLLPVQAVLAAAQACRSLSLLVADQSLWRFLYVRDFNGSSMDNLGTDWKKRYAEQHELKVRSRRKWHRLLAEMLPSSESFPLDEAQSNAPAVYLPCCVGGPYDLWPNVGPPDGPRVLPVPKRPSRWRFDPTQPPGPPRRPLFPPGPGLGGHPRFFLH